MQEYATVSSSSYDPASLASKLNDKAAEGWTVVAIVPTGGDVTAFLTREAGGAEAPASTAADVAVAPEPEPAPVSEAPSVSYEPAPAVTSYEPTPEPEPEPAPEPEPVSEPAGWAVAPESSSSSVSSTTVHEVSPEPAAVTTSYEPAAAAQPVLPVTPPPTPSVPAGWYADPAGRYELRYWDGNTWTEHVSRGGQQYTDPPVA
jgi:hypothetical protein